MAVWPKTFPPLTSEQEDIRNEFVQLWLTELHARSREELERAFRVEHRRFFPIPVPTEWCNLVIGLTLSPL